MREKKSRRMRTPALSQSTAAGTILQHEGCSCEYHRAAKLAHALGLQRQHGGDAKLLAGGQASVPLSDGAPGVLAFLLQPVAEFQDKG